MIPVAGHDAANSRASVINISEDHLRRLAAHDRLSSADSLMLARFLWQQFKLDNGDPALASPEDAVANHERLVRLVHKHFFGVFPHTGRRPGFVSGASRSRIDGNDGERRGGGKRRKFHRR